MSKCAATTVCMATGIVYVVCFYMHGLENYFPRYVSTYMGWKNYFPRTCARDIYYLRMSDYLFTNYYVHMYCLYTRGVCMYICTYLVYLF